jgi:hypothetical protein
MTGKAFIRKDWKYFTSKISCKGIHLTVVSETKEKRENSKHNVKKHPKPQFVSNQFARAKLVKKEKIQGDSKDAGMDHFLILNLFSLKILTHSFPIDLFCDYWHYRSFRF